ncbi:MAG: type II toxin-antitoxin system VapC family toxin [Terriglobales bacterium]
MPVRYLLDTNIASFVIKSNFPKVRERLLKVPMSDVGISVVTEAELRFGVARLPNATRLKTAIDEFLLRVEILTWDSQAAQQYARIRALLEREGIPLGNLDMMIAAQALAAECILVTNDQGFHLVNKLKIEDWSKV